MENAGLASIIGSVNLADVAVVVVFALFVTAGIKKGLARSVFDLCGSVIALILSNAIYPEVTKLLRVNTGLFDYLKSLVTQRLDLSGVMLEQTVKSQTTFISGLPVPKLLTDLLLGGNNDELYRIFDVTAVEDYIASYIANIIINAISLALVFVIVYAVMRWLSRGLTVFNKIPVIGALNKLGGAACGAAVGVLIIWFLFAFATLFFMRPPVNGWLDYIEGSLVAKWLYDNNIIMDMITRITL